MNGLGRSVNEQLAFLAEVGKSAAILLLSKVDGRRFLADYKGDGVRFCRSGRK